MSVACAKLRLMAAKTRICSRCAVPKPVSEFRRRVRQGKHHATAACSDCLRARDRATYRVSEDRRRRVAVAHRAAKALVHDYLREYLGSHPCVDCGESDLAVLQFDHVRGRKTAVIASLRGHSLQRVRDEIAKCDVRCGNCHRRKTVREEGWWIGAAVERHRSKVAR